MQILDVLTSPWAIQPEKLLEIQNIYATHLRGDKIDIAAVEQRIGRPLSNEQKPYDVIDGVAVIYATGVLAKRMNLFMQISGGCSMQILGNNIRSAISDNTVKSIILMMDSPGGTVDGTQDLANLIYAARDEKPIVTLSDGCMCSAAYWIGSAATRAYISSDTVAVGSIGVVAAHVDVSRQEEQMGIKTTEIYAGKFKRLATQYAPLSDEGRQSIQDYVDYLYSIFVSAVAKQRGVDEQVVLKDMADGRVFIGQQAIDAGLVDGVSTLDELIADLSASRAGVAAMPRAQSTQTKGAIMLTKEQILAEAPELVAELRQEGAAAERQRIQDVRAQCIRGHEALIETLAFDGKTTGAEAAVQILAAEKALQDQAAEQQAAAAPAAATFAAAPSDDEADAAAAAEAAMSPEEKAKAEFNASPDLQAEFKTFERYAAYLKVPVRASSK